MSKITNLIGTTWRLDGGNLTGLPEAYGQFSIIGSANVVGSASGQPVNISGSFTNINCGYASAGSDSHLVELGDTVAITFAYEGETANIPIMYNNSDNYFNVEFTITGGEDISNPLFIDFINTYGTLVSAPEPEVPTAEGVKSKLQSLITASNAKTGKSDANLTDAVKTLLEGYGKGEEVAEYDGSVVIEGAEEETVNITLNGTLVTSATQNFTDVVIKFGTPPTSASDGEYNTAQGIRIYKDGEGKDSWSLTVSPKAYIWQSYVDGNAGYRINDGSTITTGVGYANATEVILNDGDELTLVCAND